MSCCGQKRKEWLDDIKKPAGIKTEDVSLVSLHRTKPEKLFEYTGRSSLIIKGVTTGNLYRFLCKGDKVKVDYLDSFAMMGERDLQVST